MMETKELSYSDLTIKAITLLDTDDKVRLYLMETTRILKALTLCDALSSQEREAIKFNYLRFIFCCNLTRTINRKTAIKIYARFTGEYCEGLTYKTANVLSALFHEIAESISKGESKQQQQNILDLEINYLYKN